MTIQPASPDSPPTPKNKTIALVRYGTIAFFSVSVVIAWVVAAKYDPEKFPPAQKVKPAQAVAASRRAREHSERSEHPLTEQLTFLPPTATTTVIAEDGELTLPFSASQPTATATRRPGSSIHLHPLRPSGGNAGGSLADPIPPGVPADVGNDFVLTILSALRPADPIVLAADPFSLPLDPGYEYLQLEVEITCNKPATETCFFSPFEVMAAGAEDLVFGAETMIEGIDEMLEEGEYPGGSTLTGLLFLIVPTDDPTLVLFYQSFTSAVEPIYFDLP